MSVAQCCYIFHSNSGTLHMVEYHMGDNGLSTKTNSLRVVYFTHTSRLFMIFIIFSPPLVIVIVRNPMDIIVRGTK